MELSWQVRHPGGGAGTVVLRPDLVIYLKSIKVMLIFLMHLNLMPSPEHFKERLKLFS